jgi:hypothetical protein
MSDELGDKPDGLEQAETLTELLRIGGKDEMNLAEFPMTSLSDKPITGETSLKFEDQIYDTRKKKLITRKRIIEGSKEFGLPTATDDSVILALIQLTKLKNGFAEREVPFSRYELIQMLQWPNKGQSYDRIAQSLHRLASVTYHFDNSWWDNQRKTWTTKIFGIIDNVDLNDSRENDGQGGLFTSRIFWNQTVLDSFQAGYLRSLDFRLAMSFQHAISMRIYRFMGKRFHLKPEWTFDLKDFSYEHIGLSRNYEGGTQIARKLRPALIELEEAGFLEPLAENNRFTKKGREWTIHLVQKTTALPAASDSGHDSSQELHPLAIELAKRGLTETVAADFVQRYPAAFIEGKIEQFDWEMTQPKPPKRPTGYLVKSILDGYKADPNFISRAEQQRREEVRRAAEQQKAADRRQENEQLANERDMRRKVVAYLKQLDEAQRIAFEAAALAAACPADRETYQSHVMARFRETLMLGMLCQYLAGKPELEHVLAEA